jgi:putative transcriptional regulator
MIIGMGVAEARKRKGHSQRELSRMIGADASYINRLESGSFTPSLRILEKIAKELDVPIVQIFEWALTYEESVDLRRFREREAARIAKAKG